MEKSNPRKGIWCWVKRENPFGEAIWEPARLLDGQCYIGGQCVKPYKIGPRTFAPDEVDGNNG